MEYLNYCINKKGIYLLDEAVMFSSQGLASAKKEMLNCVL